jgi:CheY-specific phosphatase CheX
MSELSTHQRAASEATRRLAEAFVSATQTALLEMAGVNVTLRLGDTPWHGEGLTGIWSMVELSNPGRLLLQFPLSTATALAKRMLADHAEAWDDGLVRDCAGEVANVIAGQAKALAAETPMRFAFSVPQVGMGRQPEHGANERGEQVIVPFDSDVGSFEFRLNL